MLRIISLIAAIMLTLSMAETVTFAHSKVEKSQPAAGDTVEAGLTDLELAFSKSVRVTLVSITREGEDVPLNLTSAIPKGFVKSADVTVAPLEAGKYTVFWTAVATDGHVMKDEFSFSVTDKPTADK